MNDNQAQDKRDNEPNESMDETKHEEHTQIQEEALQSRLDEALNEAAKYKDEYIRTHADFENSKKRIEKEKATAVSFANESFANDMLGILDSIESALGSVKQADAGDDSMKDFVDGFELVYDQTLKALSRNGVEQIECVGEFDPNVHQVLMQVDTQDYETGHIVDVMQKGYMIKDRVLRPAMVSTAK